MTEPHRRPSMPRVLWLERDRVPPPPPPPEPPEPPLLFRPKSPVRERLFPSARPIARGIVRVRQGEGVRLELRVSPPPPRPAPDEDDAPPLHHAGTLGRDWLRIGARRGRGKVAVPRILAAVAAHYDVEVAEILAHRRTAHLVIPRQVAMYLAKALTGRSLPDIGRRFGGRDHTTILHGVRKIAALMQRDAELAEDVAELTAHLVGGDRREHPSMRTPSVGTSG
jgi:hypothetical protein